MRTGRVVSSVIVRVVDSGRGGTSIVLLDLQSRELREFRTWEEAMDYMRRLPPHYVRLAHSYAEGAIEQGGRPL